MLYITRKKGESIIINNNIEIKIIEVHGNKVKVGCNFPKDATILRKELHEKISNSNQESLNDAENLEEIKNFLKNNPEK